MGMESDDTVRFTFIAYLITALDRQRKRYIHKEDRINSFEIPLSSYQEGLDTDFLKLVVDFDDNLPIDQQIENPKVFSSFKGLSVGENEVFQWKIMTDYTFKEIAEIMNINESTAKSQYYSALTKMRKKLQEENNND